MELEARMDYMIPSSKNFLKIIVPNSIAGHNEASEVGKKSLYSNKILYTWTSKPRSKD